LNDKYIDTNLVNDDRYKALKDKYKALNDKYIVLLEENHPEPHVDSPTSIMEDNFSEDKVYDVADMLSKAQYQTPSLEGMIQVMNRIPFKPFQYVNGRCFSKQHNVWSYDKERSLCIIYDTK
jgi:hypothetical protein